MRSIEARKVREAVREASMSCAVDADEDLVNALIRARDHEESSVGKMVISKLLDNIEIAARERIPTCQDTGLAVFFVERGDELSIGGGSLEAAINDGVAQGYRDAYLRKSVCDPLTRANTGTNTPAIIHTTSVPGDGLKISLMAKGGGSENMSALAMLKPAQGWDGIRDFVVETARKAGANPCPPIIVGVGIGGNFERAALNSKRALLRPLDEFSPDAEVNRMEDELLEAVNELGIGPQGYGGRTTALAVRVIAEPCHIASLPVAVNIQCHASRHRTIEL